MRKGSFYLFFIFLMALSSCGNNAGNSRNSTGETAVGADASLARWDSFWAVYQQSVRNRDTTAIMRLVHTPFYQNSVPETDSDFIQFRISQLFGTESMEAPEPAEGNLLYAEDATGKVPLSFDSVRYTRHDGLDYYFAKVNGQYQLVSILTPGS